MNRSFAVARSATAVALVMVFMAIGALPAFAKPAKPTITSASAGDTTATIAWGAVAGAVNYIVTVTPGGATQQFPAPATSGTMTGLTNGTTYTFTVMAQEEPVPVTGCPGGCFSDQSAPSDPVMPVGNPGPPTGLTAVDGDEQVTLEWVAPSQTGGVPLKEYTLSYSKASGATSETIPAGTTKHTVTGLTNGASTQFSLVARNTSDKVSGAVVVSATPATVPTAALSVSGTPANRGVTLTWAAPASNGGAPILDYAVTTTPGEAIQIVPGASTTTTISNLENGSPYTFTVTARNRKGSAPASAPSAPVTPATVPASPGNVVAAPADSAASVSWTAPAGDGGSPITGYTVTASPGGATAPAAADGTSATVTGLTNGSSYTFTVTASNARGVSAASAPSAAVTPRTVPTAPADAAAAEEAGQVTVTWQAPTSNGGAAITGYRIVPSPAAPATVVDATKRTAVVENLTLGTTYTFTVQAVNEAGSGADSAPTAQVTPVTVPSVPQGVAAAPRDGALMVSWSAPESSGGLRLQGYEVTVGSVTAFAAPSSTSLLVDGLANGQPYAVAVSAINAEGKSPAAAANGTPATVPSTPASISATAGNGAARVDWTAPLQNGGDPVTGYLVTAEPGEHARQIDDPAAVSHTFNNLTNGTQYTFSVRAMNGRGTSAPASTLATPAGLPGSVGNLALAPDDQSIAVTWSAPATDGGAAVSSYEVTWSPGGATQTLAPTDRRHDVTGLVNGVEYTVSVVAVNAHGKGLAVSQSATPATVASAPQSVAATAGDAVATVTWAAPASTGGLPIGGYLVTASPGEHRREVAAATRSVSFDGLSNGTSYAFSVRAVNGRGNGAPGDAEATPGRVTTAPTAVSAIPGDETVEVTWQAPASNGGFDVTGYKVRRSSSAGDSTVELASSARSHTFTGLVNGVEQTVSVVAVNAKGDSAAATDIATPATVAGAPQSVSATAGDALATVSWAAPASTGGLPIGGYLVTASPGDHSREVAATATSATFTQLVNGATYTFQVRAINGRGNGAPATAQAAPGTVTTPPAGVTATGGDTTVAVTWQAPASNGGFDVIGYKVRRSSDAGDSTAELASSARSHTFTGVVNGVEQSVSVVAVNAKGDSAPANAVATPLGAATASLSSSAGSVDSGAKVTLTGSLAGAAATPVANETVSLERRLPNGTWVKEASGVTQTDGRATFEQTLHDSTTYRLAYDGGASRRSALSEPLSITARAIVTAGAAPISLKQGTSSTFAGKVVPARGQTVVLEVLTAEGWSAVASKPVTDTGAFVFAVKPAASGISTYRVRKDADAFNPIAYSANSSLTVYSAHIGHVQGDAVGNDARNLNGGYVVVRNTGSAAFNLSGWKLAAKARAVKVRLPALRVPAGARVRIYTGSGKNTSSALYLRQTKPLWSDAHDRATLSDANGVTVDVYAY